MAILLSRMAVPLCGSRKRRLGGVLVAAPQKGAVETRPRRAPLFRGGGDARCVTVPRRKCRAEKERKTVYFLRDAGGQCSVSRRPCKRRGGRERGSPAPPLAAADARRLASPSPRPFIPMSRGAPAERGKRARVTSARARRTFPRDGGTSARHELLLRAATSAAQGPTWPAAFASQRSRGGKIPPP